MLYHSFPLVYPTSFLHLYLFITYIRLYSSLPLLDLCSSHCFSYFLPLLCAYLIFRLLFPFNFICSFYFLFILFFCPYLTSSFTSSSFQHPYFRFLISTFVNVFSLLHCFVSNYFLLVRSLIPFLFSPSTYISSPPRPLFHLLLQFPSSSALLCSCCNLYFLKIFFLPSFSFHKWKPEEGLKNEHKKHRSFNVSLRSFLAVVWLLLFLFMDFVVADVLTVMAS